MIQMPRTAAPEGSLLSSQEIHRLRRNLSGPGKRQAPPGPPVLDFPRLPPRPMLPPPAPRVRNPYAVDLECGAGGREFRLPQGGVCHLVETRVAEIPRAERLDADFQELFTGRAPSALHVELAALGGPAFPAPAQLIFVDVESTGLGNSALFLVGVMVRDADGLVIRQYFARDYAEEACVVRCFIEDCRDKALLISFNGKSFDFPFIRARAAATGTPFELAPAHLDLLHASRRVWKGRLPDCKLQTLERLICNRTRVGDIPGADIPEVYHSYVRTSDAYEIVDVLLHNRLDLVTLADIMTRFPAGPAVP